jgi:NAD(P)-dependent dehydrogenase (short-subunit alcohol dehydrogenase family)
MGVLVAGGSGALGQAVVRELLDFGYACTVTWVVEKERGRAEENFGARIDLLNVDLFDPDATSEAVGSVEGLEAVVDLVGGFASGGLVHETDPQEFARMIELNLTPAFNLARAAMPLLLERGSGAFVGVSARPALRPFAGAAGYITGKAAVLAFIHALDAEYRRDGIRCNAILPSVIDTPANRAEQPDADYSKWVAPEAIAKVIRFLVSDDSAPTSGAAVPVYGRA